VKYMMCAFLECDQEQSGHLPEMESENDQKKS